MAVSTVVDIALYSRERPVLAFDLAKRLHVRARHLEPVMQALAREGILVGVRGRNGGYKLAKERRAISAYDILQTVKTIEADMSTQSYSGLAGAVVLPALAQAEQIFASSLKRTTVEDLVQLALQSTPLARKARRVRTDL
jgi:Rrf2 family protein